MSYTPVGEQENSANSEYAKTHGDRMTGIVMSQLEYAKIYKKCFPVLHKNC